ncbi:MAG TPA: protein-L-isoaspartate(D-aspartate) O-methyltransferase [Lacipirellulaceae bacterium]
MRFDLARHNMVVHQLERRGILDPRVLEAMEWVPREEFVPPELVDLAYDDRALPIGLEQTISQPYTVAFMCQEARLTANDKVLEIGTGSGYGAAVLSLLAHEVHTIERIEELFHAARDRLARLAYDNVRVYLDDGTHGLPREAPFDAIVCTAGAEVLPEAYGQQLADGGRLVIPIGPPAHQQMIRLTRRGDTWDRDILGSFGFVPLVGND